MAEFDDGVKRSNGGEGFPRPIEIDAAATGGDTLFAVLRSFLNGVFSPEESPPPPLIQRVRGSFCENLPRLRKASTNSARDLILWTRRGSPLRALFVISVGTITLLALTGLLVFMLFFLAATLNAIIISLLMSLAAAGGFLAFFFVCLTAIYVGAISVAIFVISATTITTIVAVLIATGWVGFFWIIWLAARKSLDLTKQSLNMTSSAISAYSASRQARRSTSSKSE